MGLLVKSGEAAICPRPRPALELQTKVRDNSQSRLNKSPVGYDLCASIPILGLLLCLGTCLSKCLNSVLHVKPESPSPSRQFQPEEGPSRASSAIVKSLGNFRLMF